MSWRRVNHHQPCPVCGKANWCTITEDGQWSRCMRASTGDRPCTNKHGELIDGWYVRLKGSVAQNCKSLSKESEKIGYAEIEIVRRQEVSAVNPTRLKFHAKQLGVSVDSLGAFRIGWNGERQAWSFPMTGANGLPNGIRYRRDDGAKWSLRGGSEGVFIPQTQPESDILIICEGPTSAAAWWDLGFAVMGRSSCTGGKDIFPSILAGEDRGVLIMADRDSVKKRPDGSTYCPGPDGAEALYKTLTNVRRRTWAICPVQKDGRDWIKRGATHAIVMDWINKYVRGRRIEKAATVKASA